MEKEQFIKEFNQELEGLNENELKEFINELVLNAKNSKYDYFLFKIKNFKNEENPLDEKTIKEYNNILKKFTKVENGEICLKSYSYWTGTYSYYDEDTEYVYYPSKELHLFLVNLGQLLEKLVLYKEYKKVIELFDRLYNTTFLCEEIGNPEYADNNDVIDSYDVEFQSVIDDLNIDTSKMCLLCIYSLIMTKDPNLYEKIFDYNRHFYIEFENLNTYGLTQIENYDEFYQGWLNYQKEHEKDKKY